jgi:hypothetical protein
MGKKARSSERLSVEDEDCFPNLYESRYRVVSPKDKSHNCIAYAAGDTTRKWDPSMIPFPGYYWPPNADRGREPDALKSVFESIGYEVCENGDLEEGYEKVALYVSSENGRWTHAARQQQNGEWTSKLGNEQDIRHRSPHCFGGSDYGDVVYFMKRIRAGAGDEEEAKTIKGITNKKNDEPQAPE